MTTEKSAKNEGGRMKHVPIVAGLLAIGFGMMTLIEGGHVLFGGPEAYAAAGKVVPWVLYFNFSAGFVYIATGGLSVVRKGYARHLALGLAAANVVVFTALLVHVFVGGPYESRTVMAMTLRTVFWMVQAFVLRRALS